MHQLSPAPCAIPSPSRHLAIPVRFDEPAAERHSAVRDAGRAGQDVVPNAVRRHQDRVFSGLQQDTQIQAEGG